MMKVFFRLATQDDRDFISQLSASVFSMFGNYDDILTNWFLQPGVLTIIVMEETDPLGFAMLGLAREGDFESYAGELLAMAVIPEYQRRGIGNALLTNIESLALQYGLSELHLHTARDNKAACSFFKKAGFKIIGFRQSYYPKGQPALMMTKMFGS